MFNLMPEKYTAEQQIILSNVNLMRGAINDIERRTKNAYTESDEVKSLLVEWGEEVRRARLIVEQASCYGII